MSEVTLDSLRDCLRAGLPFPLATCDADGVPDIAYAAQIQYLDAERVAISRQAFNRSFANLGEHPFAQALITRSTTGEEFRLDLRYLHTTTEGEAFDAVRANLEAVAPPGPDFRLRGLDVHQVLRCTRVPRRSREVLGAEALDVLAPLEQLTRRLEGATTYAAAAQEIVDALDDLFGFGCCALMTVDGSALQVIAGSGHAQSVVGARIEPGDSLPGAALARRQVIVVANFERSRVVSGAAFELMLPDARSAAAVPLLSAGRLLGVLHLQSDRPSAFGGTTESLLRVLGGQVAGALAARGAPVAQAAEPDDRPPFELVYYQADDTVMCKGTYVVKGAVGRILWAMLRSHADTGRTEFTNRELRLDESLGLPAGRDNLEARLLALRRRLTELQCGIELDRVGRGRLELRVAGRPQLSVVPTGGPMRGAVTPAN